MCTETLPDGSFLPQPEEHIQLKFHTELQRGNDWDSSDCILKYPEDKANPKRKRTKKIWEWMESSQLTSAFEWSNGRNSESQQVTAAWRSSHNVERYCPGGELGGDSTTLLYYFFPSLTSGNMIKTMTSKSLTRKEHPYSSSKKSVLKKCVGQRSIFPNPQPFSLFGLCRRACYKPSTVTVWLNNFCLNILISQLNSHN